MSAPEASSRPALAPGIRLQTDRATGNPVLLGPETIHFLNPTAADIVGRCDGQRTVAAIVESLAAEYDAPAESLRADVLECLAGLAAENLVVWA